MPREFKPPSKSKARRVIHINLDDGLFRLLSEAANSGYRTFSQEVRMRLTNSFKEPSK